MCQGEVAATRRLEGRGNRQGGKPESCSGGLATQGARKVVVSVVTDVIIAVSVVVGTFAVVAAVAG